MKRNFWLRQLPVALLAGGLAVTAAAWQNPGAAPQPQRYADTIPERNRKVKDIDDAIAELERGRTELEQSMKDRNWEKEVRDAMKSIDAAKIRADIDKAMKEIDVTKLQADVQKALKEVDFEKIQKELQLVMKDVDSDKIRAEIAGAMKSLDAAKIRADVDASLARVDMEKVRVEIEKVRDIDFGKMEAEMKKMQPEIEKALAEARVGIDKAKVELTAYKTFIDGLAKDGLIDKNANYTIVYKDGELSVNGKKQPESVVRQWADFLKGRKDFTIRKEADDFDINNND